MTKRVLVAAALLLVLFAVAWFATPEPESAPPAPPKGAADDAVSAAADRTSRNAATRHAKQAAADESSSAAANDAVPAPVDLEHADRDLDVIGVVVDAAGKGIAGAKLATLTYPWRKSNLLNTRDYDLEVAGPATRSASDGTFAIRMTRGANAALRVAATGFASIEMPSVVAGERVKVVMGPGVRLIVALTDPAGAPVAGASVRIFNNTDRGGLRIQSHGTSGADGVCTFDGLPPSEWLWIDPKYPKGAGGWTRVTLPATGEVRQDIQFPPSRTLTGSVVDAETRHAVEGAEVGMNWTLDQSVKTKADGSFELPGWTGAGVNDVHVLAEGYSREVKIVGKADRLEFAMQRGFAVTGHVVGADASAVAGAFVSLIGSEMSNGEQRISTGYATTGADGRFRVTGLRVGMRHALVVTARGFARLRRDTASGTVTEDVALGDVVLGAPHRVEGVVVGSDGTPQTRVQVTLSGPSADASRRAGYEYGQSVSVFTDDVGRFRFDDAAPGAYTLKSRAAGAPEITGTATVPADGDALGVKLVRESAREVVVKVTDEAGAAVANAYVSADGTTGQRISSQTDAQGIARLGVPTKAVVKLTVFVAEDKRAFLQSPQRELGADESAVTIVLEEGAAVTGRIVDPDGAPVAMAWIEFSGPGDAHAFALSEADGSFRTLVRKGGRSTLVFDGRVGRTKMEDSGLSARVEDVAPGAEVAVRCERVANDRKLSVVVVSPTGDPVAGATVQLLKQMGTAGSAVTDDAGRAAFENLPAREVRVFVSIKSTDFLAPVMVSAVPAGQEVRATCRTASRITGIVTDDAGTPLPYGSVGAARGESYLGYAPVGKDGRFTLLLPSEETAPVRLTIDRDNDRKPDAVLESVAPGTQDVRLVVRK